MYIKALRLKGSFLNQAKIWGFTEAWNFTKISTPVWVFFMFFKLLKCYQIAQRITYAICFFITYPKRHSMPC